MAEDQEVQSGKILAVLAYLWILFLLPLLLQKENKFALHHGKQGLVLFIGWVALALLGWVPILGWILAPIGAILLFVAAIVGIIQALQGNYWKCPVISDIADKIKI